MSMVRQAVTRLTLDMSLDAVQKSVAISKNDTNRRMEITLTDAGRPFALPSTWSATLSGGQLEDGCVVDRGRILYDLAGGVLTAEAGIFELAFRVFDEEGDEVASPMITCNVYDVARNTEAVTSTDEFSVLQEFVKNINEVDTRLDVVEESTKDAAERLGSAEGRLDEAETRLDDGEAWQQEADGRLDSLDVWLGDLESSTEEMQENLEELTASVALIGKRSIISMVTINPSEWSDSDPYVTFNSIFVGFDNPYSSATILLIPRDPQTRAEARKMELSVDYAYPSSVLLSFWMTRTEYAPTVPLNFAALTVLSDTSPGDTGFSIAASIVGVTELPDELMDKEVLRVLDANKYANEERVTELINEALGVIENGSY